MLAQVVTFVVDLLHIHEGVQLLPQVDPELAQQGLPERILLQALGLWGGRRACERLLDNGLDVDVLFLNCLFLIVQICGLKCFYDRYVGNWIVLRLLIRQSQGLTFPGLGRLGKRDLGLLGLGS